MLKSNKYKIFAFYFSKFGVVHQTGRLNLPSTSLKEHLSRKRLFTSCLPCSQGSKVIETHKYSSRCSTHSARACTDSNLSAPNNFIRSKSSFFITDHISRSFHSTCIIHSESLNNLDGSSEKSKKKYGSTKNTSKQGSRGSHFPRNSQKVRF